MKATSNEIIVDKKILTILNQLFEIERKLDGSEDFNKISRNISRIKDSLSQDANGQEIFYENPMGQKYTDTRNDLEAHIIGESTENLVVVDVIKPIILFGNRQLGLTQVVQRGVVSVESKSINKEEK
ncbi:hypothetical protein [Flavobacterium sp. W21_SRS_FM6]|uniref:hypothetical protein n=1 Tax=Flavobacterium sp. W21_SRS_FM6 TaxID=3240268 RepID=UPI003F8DE6F1